MNEANNLREKILGQVSYWIEGINSELYNAIRDYMERKNLNQTQMAKHLGISKGRMSQILNDGEINFSIEKLIGIALKIDRFPVFKLEDQAARLSSDSTQNTLRRYMEHHELPD